MIASYWASWENSKYMGGKGLENETEFVIILDVRLDIG